MSEHTHSHGMNGSKPDGLLLYALKAQQHAYEYMPELRGIIPIDDVRRKLVNLFPGEIGDDLERKGEEALRQLTVLGERLRLLRKQGRDAKQEVQQTVEDFKARYKAFLVEDNRISELIRHRSENFNASDGSWNVSIIRTHGSYPFYVGFFDTQKNDGPKPVI